MMRHSSEADRIKELIKKQKDATRHESTQSFTPGFLQMSTQLENPEFDTSFFQQALPKYYRASLKELRHIARSFVLFHLVFNTLLALEGLTLLLLSCMEGRSSLLALTLGTLFLTGFSYLVLFFYYQEKKTEQLHQLRDQFIQSCKQILSLPDGEAEKHLALSAALSNLAYYLQDFEWIPNPLPSFLKRPLSRFFDYCHSQDLFKLKLLFLQTAIDEHIQQIHFTPTDLEVHASLAGAYIDLSKVYLQSMHSEKWSFERKNRAVFEEKFRSIARLAMEEFQILNDYAPDDPWVHEQLAKGYRDLQMPEEEIREMEILLKLRPQDRDILFRLGTLYFKQGHSAKGLRIYEELKQANFKKAESLISAYGTSLFQKVSTRSKD